MSKPSIPPRTSCPGSPPGHSHGDACGGNLELVFAILCGICLLLGWLISLYLSGSNWGSFACYLLAYLFGCFFFDAFSTFNAFT